MDDTVVDQGIKIFYSGLWTNNLTFSNRNNLKNSACQLGDPSVGSEAYFIALGEPLACCCLLSFGTVLLLSIIQKSWKELPHSKIFYRPDFFGSEVKSP